MTSDILDNHEIDWFIRKDLNLSGKYGGIYGVVGSDIRPFNKATCEEPSIYVFLLQPDENSTGHWVCVLKRNKNFIYYDPFGSIPPRIIFEEFPNLGVSSNVYQRLSEDDCGIICLRIIEKKFSKN